MKIKFFNNGFEVSLFNGIDIHKIFITYQSIAQIYDVDITIDKTLYDILKKKYDKPTVGKYAYFTIMLNNGKYIDLSFDSSYKHIPRVDHKNWFYRLIGNGANDDVNTWLEHKKMDMYEPVNELRDFRIELIKKFNNWKNCSKNTK